MGIEIQVGKRKWEMDANDDGLWIKNLRVSLMAGKHGNNPAIKDVHGAYFSADYITLDKNA